ncbi:hypothetical protein ALT1644_640005 [Alteromonas macleodii]
MPYVPTPQSLALGIELDFIYFSHNYDTIGKLTIMVTWRLRG